MAFTPLHETLEGFGRALHSILFFAPSFPTRRISVWGTPMMRRSYQTRTCPRVRRYSWRFVGFVGSSSLLNVHTDIRTFPGGLVRHPDFVRNLHRMGAVREARPHWGGFHPPVPAGHQPHPHRAIPQSSVGRRGGSQNRRSPPKTS